MNPLLFLQSLALHLAWMEGKDNGTNGVLAVLFCIRNRIAANWENGDLSRILQGEWYHRHLKDVKLSELPTLIEIPDTRDPKFKDAMGYLESIFNNTAQDRLTEGALYWGDNPIGATQRVAKVGSLLLWR